MINELDVPGTWKFEDLRRLKTCPNQASTIGNGGVYFSCKATPLLRPCDQTEGYCVQNAQTSLSRTKKDLLSQTVRPITAERNNYSSSLFSNREGESKELKGDQEIFPAGY